MVPSAASAPREQQAEVRQDAGRKRTDQDEVEALSATGCRRSVIPAEKVEKDELLLACSTLRPLTFPRPNIAEDLQVAPLPYVVPKKVEIPLIPQGEPDAEHTEEESEYSNIEDQCWGKRKANRQTLQYKTRLGPHGCECVCQEEAWATGQTELPRRDLRSRSQPREATEAKLLECMDLIANAFTQPREPGRRAPEVEVSHSWWLDGAAEVKKPPLHSQDLLEDG